ncbi:winged helix-turn-helix domain-containing protein [Paraburkholderia sprentiae WSM5005]|uniref:Winged helix-turn-helix domain-containing protein n=1 Tax=Paraburkholderia sprentiae WSM5005 TaxID=754502 RepID=A0A1I9YH11_9BURK|nr:winged helix-turn-helix domain-containing protein [Paraburkholderia sprentiae]APA85594.1 winged helix-turn-helix domain-containing protein [Paraburkholderia sprentiae WSM5005]
MKREDFAKTVARPAGAASAGAEVLHYPGFDIDIARGELRVAGRPAPLRPKTFALLLHLARNPGRLLSRGELIEAVWREVIVTDDSLVQCVSELRAALGGEHHHVVRTVPRRGYMFDVAAVGTPNDERLPSTDAPRQLGLTELGALSPSNLSADLPPLFGRAEDVAALVRLLEVSRMVSVVGSAGVGKTTVARAVAHRLRDQPYDGVWVVELASLADGRLLVPTVARTLGHQVARDGGPASLVRLISTQRLLLVLDNCEHLLDHVAALVKQIMAGAPGVHVLVTSQEPLHTEHEQVFRLDPLGVPTSDDAVAALGFGAVQMFVARAKAADPKFDFDAHNARDVIDTCRRLDGIPLAIEFAAARVSLLGAFALRQRLDERMKLLAGGIRTALPRHQTLRAALQWSYGLLTPPEKSVFDRLGVFMGSFSLEAAQRVASDATLDEWAVFEQLASLVDKSLVVVQGMRMPRYHLLESNRSFALERLAAIESLEATRRRHAEAMTECLTGKDYFEEPLARTRRIAPELDNVRAAAAWAISPTGDRMVAIDLAAATDMLWDARGFNDEGARLYRNIEPWVDQLVPPVSAARFWFAVADLRMRTEAKRQAEAALKAAALFRSLSDRFGTFRSLTVAAHQFTLLANREGARQALDEAATLLDGAWPEWLETSLAFCRVLFSYLVEGDHATAKKLADAAIVGHRLGDSFFGDRCALMLPSFDLAAGDFTSALRRCDEILASSSVAESVQLRSQTLVIRGAALVNLGDLREADATLRTACTLLMHAIGPSIYPYCYAAHLLALQGRLADAARTIGWIEARMRQANRDGIPPIALSSYKAARDIVDSALSSDERDGYAGEGALLSLQQVTRIAFPGE